MTHINTNTALDLTSESLALQMLNTGRVQKEERKKAQEVSKTRASSKTKSKYNDNTKALIALAQALIAVEEILAKSHVNTQRLQAEMGTRQIDQANKNYEKVAKAVAKYEHAKHEHHSWFHKLVSSLGDLLGDIINLLKKIPGVGFINSAVNAAINDTAQYLHKKTGINTELAKGLITIAIIMAVSPGQAAEEAEAEEGVAGAEDAAAGAPEAGEAAAVPNAAELGQEAAVAQTEETEGLTAKKCAKMAAKSARITRQLVATLLFATQKPITNILVGGLKQAGEHNSKVLMAAQIIGNIADFLMAAAFAPDMDLKSNFMSKFIAFTGVVQGVNGIWNGVEQLDTAKAMKEYAKAMKKFTLSEEFAKLLQGFADQEQKQTQEMFKGFNTINKSFSSYTLIDRTEARIMA